MLRKPTADELRAQIARLRLELVALHDLRVQPGVTNFAARERTLVVAVEALERQLARAAGE